MSISALSSPAGTRRPLPVNEARPDAPPAPPAVSAAPAAPVGSRAQGARGAAAAPPVPGTPSYATTAAAAADAGAYQLMGAGQPGTAGTVGATERAPVPGVDAGSVRSADGPVTSDGSSWSPEWKQKFSDAMSRMGLSSSEIATQLKSVESMPVTEQQLQTMLDQMQEAIGSFDDAWKQKFTKLLKELGTSADEQQQVLQQLAGSGLDDAKLTEAYTQMEATRPAWSAAYERKFKELDVPEELLKQLKDSKAPAAMLDEQFTKLVDTKAKYEKDGRLAKLEKAGATGAEKWSVMLQGTEGKDFDKAVEQIHSAHVPAWKRIGSIALNLIPGVYAAQYLTGKDWLTGDKIDRTNPLNIIGAVASGFAGFTMVRGAVNAVRTGGALWQAARGASLVGSTLSKGTSALGIGTVNAVNDARIATTLLNSSKAGFQLKSLVGSVARVGSLGRVSSVVRGYGQGMQLAASAAATHTLADGSKVVDKAIRSDALGVLRKGGSIDDVLRSTGTGRSALSGTTIGDDLIRSGYNANGFVQKGGNWRLNPFKRDATMTAGIPRDGATVWNLGRGVNFGTRSGQALGMGSIEAAKLGQTGVSAAAVANVGETAAHVARWSKALNSGASGGALRGAANLLGVQSRAVSGMVTGAERGAETAYKVSRVAANLGQKYGSYASIGIVGGAAVGMTGPQMQPMWDYVKNRSAIQAGERERADAADQEAAELERIYAAEHGGAAGAGAGAAAPNSNEPEVVGTSPSGADLVYFPEQDMVVDQGNGDIYDPNTQQIIGNMGQASGGGEQQVYVDPNTGYYVDPQTGLAADPATGQVYDTQGAVVGSIGGAEAGAATADGVGSMP